jgi:hypothetical protein
MRPTTLLALAGVLVTTAHAAEVLHYWDMDTVDGGVPIDLVGGLVTTAGANLDLTHAAYGPAGGSGGAYLHTVIATDGVPLTAEIHNGSTATALVFTGSFSFSYWSYDDSSDLNGSGPRTFDCLSGTDTGMQLSTTPSGALNFRMDDNGGNEVLSKDETDPDPTQAVDAWTFVAVNVDRTSNQAEIFFNGASQATYGITALTGDIVPSHDLQIGAINGGGLFNHIQTAGLDDLAFYDGLLSGQNIADLYAGTITPDDLSAVPQPSGVALADFTYDPTDGSAEVRIEGAATTAYKLVEADDLDFLNPDQDPIPLTGATVGTLDGDKVTTDGSGNATVQFTLGNTKTATFLRAEETVP